MKLSHLKSLVLAAVLAAATSVAVAQELRIGYINSERLLREAAPAKAAQAKLEAEFGRREREITDDAAQLKAAADRLDKDAPTLAETERNRRQRELVDRDRDLQRKRRAFQEDLNQRKNEELANVVERAKDMLDEAEAEHRSFDEKIKVATARGLDVRDQIRSKAQDELNAKMSAEKARLAEKLEGALVELEKKRREALADVTVEAEKIAELTASKLLGRSV